MISVIIPVYNVEEYLDDCLTSVLAQTYSNLEILLINDGSTDNSGVICDKYAQTDSRIKVFHKENGGVSSARNIGLENATGQYIAFVDPDDWIEPNMYETIITQFEKSDVDAVFCGYWENFSDEVKRNPVIHMPEKHDIVSGRDALYQCLIKMEDGYFTSVWNKVFKTEFVNQQDILFEPFLIGEDEVWLAKILPEAKNIFLINKPLYHWRKRESSVLHKKDGYTKWYSALDAKKEAITAVRFDKELFELSNAKLYSDEFDKIWIAYTDGDFEVCKNFIRELKPYEWAFYRHRDHSKLRRVKFFIIKQLIAFRFPKAFVKIAGDTTKYRIKEKLGRL